MNINCAVVARYVTTGHVLMTPFIPEDSSGAWAASIITDFLVFMFLPWSFSIGGLISEYVYGIRDQTLLGQLSQLVTEVASFALMLLAPVAVVPVYAAVGVAIVASLVWNPVYFLYLLARSATKRSFEASDSPSKHDEMISI